jgi:photosystem II stability/assembly factor-like uncharacterized protein
MSPRSLPLASAAAVLLSLAGPGIAGRARAATPEPATEAYVYRNVNIGGGGFVSGIFFNPVEKDLCYLRTDVGGAYRWEPAAGRWQPLLDWVGQKDWGLQGVESLATDPVEPGRVYIAAGTYTRNGTGEILRSTDYGRTWRRTPVPIRFGGNEAGRNTGERLAIDPNDHRILFLGTRQDGLWRSEDFGATWARVTSFPDVPDGSAWQAANPATGLFNFPPQAVGLNVVRFDPRSGGKGAPTPVLYAAVSTPKQSLYRSLDGGKSWAPVPGQPLGLRPTRTALSADGTLYISYGKEPGPNRMTDGAVWKLDTASGQWTDVTPERPAASKPFGYGSVSVDPQHPETVLAATWSHGRPFDLIYRSTNGGRTWETLLLHAQWDHASAPYTTPRRHHWLADVEVDPFDSNHAIFPTGYGIWVTRDLGQADLGKPTHWSFDDQGIEETVPLALASPPEGAHLVSGLGDIDGFRHDDLDVSPPNLGFDGPRFKDTTSVAFAWRRPEVFVRCGNTYKNDLITAQYSQDGARTWKAFAGEPPGTIGARWRGMGSIAISPDAKVVVWTPIRDKPYLTRDWGASWQACANGTAGLRVVADTVNSRRFYAYDAGAGVVLVSDDGAASFRAAARGLPVTRGFWGPAGGDIHAVPGHEGELWIVAKGGLYRSSDGGGSFDRIDSAGAVALGFGKAAPGRDYPAMFIAGQVGDVAGFFRSDDAGSTWIHINDGQHQYGEIRSMTGDPRIFGRFYFGTGGRGILYGDPVPNKVAKNELGGA